MRHYPALLLEFRTFDQDLLDRALAIVDDDGPVAADEQDGAWRIFFATADARTRAGARLAAADLPVSITATDVDDEDWGRRSQPSLTDVQVGQFLVLPQEDAPRNADTHTLLIPPSMGFGTGHHASTRLCLQLLQRIPNAGRRVLDVGTGSGILAIAAAKLGAREIVAIDVDEDALTAASENVARNHVEVSLRQVDLASDAIDGAPFDVVLANLTGAHLTRYASRISSVAAPGAHLIASGFQTDERREVSEALAGLGWRILEAVSESEWVGLCLRF